MIGLAVRRPVAVTMAYAAIALLGIVAWRNLPIELLPNTELPRLTVTASWPGASPETVEAFLTAPLEAVLQQVRGVERIESVSEEGSARVSLELEPDADMQFVRLELSERLAALERDLPAGVRGPWAQAYVPEEFREQARSFMRYTVTGPYTLETLRALVDTAIAPPLRDVEGVAEVVAAGGRRRLLEIELDDARVRALGLGEERVRQAVAQLDLRRSGGAVAQQGLLRPVALRDDIESIDEILAAPVIADGRRLIRLRDVATVHDTYEEASSHYRVDGRPAVSFEVFRAAGSNAVRVAHAVRAAVGALDPPPPVGVRLILDEDQSDAIRAQVGDLKFRALVGAGVIFVVLLLFLGSVRSAAIVFTTIAFSILFTLNLVYFGGMSLNMLTLMGLALGFGLIDDNAIVVLESVYRRWRLGESPAAAAEHGAREVVLPVVAATATTVVVVVPFIWLQGELRAYYIPLGIVVGFSMIASLLVAFTFIPAVAAGLLRARPPIDPDAPAARDAWYVRAYAGVVRAAVRHPWPVVVAALLAVGGSYWVFDKHVQRGVLWTSWWNDQTWISIQIELPRGAELERTDQYARFFEDRLRAMTEIERFTTTVGPTNASIRATFPDSLEATSVPLVIKEQLVALSHQFGGADVRVYGFGPSFYGGGSSPPNYTIEVLGYNYEMVRDIAEDLGARLKRFSRVRDVDTNSWGRWYEDDRATEVVLRLDRRRLAMHGLTARDVVAHVASAVGGSTRGDVIMVGGREQLFTVKLQGSRDADVLGLEQLLVPAPRGGEVRLGEVATLEEREVMSRIVRENQQYQRLVTYEFRGPPKLGDRYNDAVMAATALPPGFALEEAASWSWDDEEQKQIWGVVIAALLLVFMTTAALFESLRQPFIVLLTVPMALVGVFLIFWLTGASFTREAYIGVIMMGGIVVNNSILLVDRFNQLVKAGSSAADAAVRGTLDRVQPILMTTATTVFGLLPLVLFSESADANIWNALGYALIGGLTSSTVLVLTVTPALLVVLSRPRAPARPRGSSP